MSRYSTLMNRIEAGEQVFIDGATGTEIERRGVPQLDNAWNGGGALSHPEILRAVHEDYISAGAEIVISNTFATLKSALRDAGLKEDFDAYNRRGVELACEARAALGFNTVVVAGGISHWSWSGNHPTLEELRDNATEQAAIMKEAGADLIIISRTQKDLDQVSKIIKKFKSKCTSYVCDVANYHQIKNIINKQKKIDILVNNAGTNIPEHFTKVQKKNME